MTHVCVDGHRGSRQAYIGGAEDTWGRSMPEDAHLHGLLIMAHDLEGPRLLDILGDVDDGRDDMCVRPVHVILKAITPPTHNQPNSAKKTIS